MGDSDSNVLLGGASLALALVAYLWPSEASAARSAKVNPEDFAAAKAVVNRWAGPGSPFPNVPRALVLAIIKAESRFHPKSEDHSERAEGRGGAYGLMGMTAATARDLLPKFQKLSFGHTQVARYQTLGTSALLDPDVNTLFGVFYLNQLGAEFGFSNSNIAAAYHEGPGRVRALEAGPHTRQYVADVTAYRKEFEGKS